MQRSVLCNAVNYFYKQKTPLWDFWNCCHIFAQNRSLQLSFTFPAPQHQHTFLKNLKLSVFLISCTNDISFLLQTLFCFCCTLEPSCFSLILLSLIASSDKTPNTKHRSFCALQFSPHLMQLHTRFNSGRQNTTKPVYKVDFKICKNNKASEFVLTKGAKPFSKPRGNHAVFSWSQLYGPLVVVFTLKLHFLILTMS